MRLLEEQVMEYMHIPRGIKRELVRFCMDCDWKDCWRRDCLLLLFIYYLVVEWNSGNTKTLRKGWIIPSLSTNNTTLMARRFELGNAIVLAHILDKRSVNTINYYCELIHYYYSIERFYYLNSALFHCILILAKNHNFRSLCLTLGGLLKNK